MSPPPQSIATSCPCPVLPDVPDVNYSSDTNPTYTAPSSVLIVGSGVFGLSTAFSLTQNPAFGSTTITVLDRSPEPDVFPARDAASIDSSRIIRADYADAAYAALASEAQAHWRQTSDPASIGGEGRYSQSGLLLAAHDGETVREDGHPTGLGYAKKSWVNSLALAQKEGRPLSTIRMLPNRHGIGVIATTGGEFADWGYLNEGSGWADAEASMRWMYEKVVRTGRVSFVNGTAESLETSGTRVTGARLKDGSTLSADLVVLAAGAWTPSLIDLSSQAVATGQVLGYIDITEEEQAKLDKMPVILNISTGHFIIPPRNRVLKVARHSYGYLNPSTVPQKPLGAAKDGQTDISQPFTHLDDANLAIPPEGEAALREALRKMIPWPELQSRPFTKTRLCWYTDTATGDWIIDYHPDLQGLFVATGGSGHAFKFLPVIGDKVVGCIMGQCPAEFKEKWKWGAVGDVREAIATEDGSRGGRPGLVLQDEYRKVPGG